MSQDRGLGLKVQIKIKCNLQQLSLLLFFGYPVSTRLYICAFVLQANFPMSGIIGNRLVQLSICRTATLHQAILGHQ